MRRFPGHTLRLSLCSLALALSTIAGGCGGEAPASDAGGSPDAFVVGDTGVPAEDGGGSGDDASLGDSGARDAGLADAGLDVDSGVATDASVEVDAASGTFTLTSPSLVEGGVIDDMFSCAGANISPQLDWVSPPAGTLSFGVLFRDVSTNFRHSAIYDIPATATGLPEDVDAVAMPPDVPGARQPRGYDGSTRGYLGPCPGSMHRYQFTLYALDVAMLPGLTAMSSLAQVETAFDAHSLGEATLSGTFTP